jgi:riboflavin kinase/FMN adenylyltransferase
MSTRVIRSFYNVTRLEQGGVLTIGNFDGVHIGHQALITAVMNQAREFQAPALLITFEPHPFEFFMQENLTIPRITRLREKVVALSNCGMKNIIIFPFNQMIANLSASDFVTNILCQYIKPKHILVGDDFRFGHKRQGDTEMLQRMGQTLGFSVSAIPSMMTDGVRVSSTLVRQALQVGDLKLAERMLGRPYTMLGRVRYGDQLGRRLGFPTANIDLQRKLTPLMGVFSVLVHGLADRPLPGAANIGTRPTVNGTRTLLEVHLLDFNQDIYGRQVQVEFCQKLRDEVRYPNIDLLKEQIADDVAVVRRYFNSLGYL